MQLKGGSKGQNVGVDIAASSVTVYRHESCYIPSRLLPTHHSERDGSLVMVTFTNYWLPVICCFSDPPSLYNATVTSIHHVVGWGNTSGGYFGDDYSAAI